MKTKLFTLLALALCAGAVFSAFAVPVYAAAEPENDASPPAVETLSVDEVWLTGDTLHIAVTDKTDGEIRTLELNLSDYAEPGDEYVTVRAADKDGRVSNTVQFKNPYYVPQAGTESDDASTAPSGDKPSETPEQSESAVPDSSNAFTPDGTGTVIDNAADSDGKEFFTVETVDGNVFYLIVDRERGADNVYLLNAVTERDLASLAKAGDSLGEDGMTSSAVPAPSAPQTTKTEIEPAPEPTPEPETPAKPGGMGSGATVFIILAALAAGGAGYYFKILRPKRLAAEPDDAGEYEDEPEDGDDFYDGAETDAYDDERGNGE